MQVCKVTSILFSCIVISLNLFSQALRTDSSCIERIEIRKVSGNSMSGIVENGESLRILFGFYACNPVNYNDIAVYSYAGSKIPLIKSVKALPSDTFHVQCRNGNCFIEVNRQEIKNKQGALYYIPEKESSLLKYYEKSFQGIIPPGTFMILGSHNGTIDSGKFGLVGIGDLIGKAEMLK
jgi:signal peptidase I